MFTCPLLTAECCAEHVKTTMVTNFTISPTEVRLCGIPAKMRQKAHVYQEQVLLKTKVVFRDCNFKLTCVILREEPMLENVLNPLLQLWISLDLWVILVVEAQHSLHKPLTNADKNNFIISVVTFRTHTKLRGEDFNTDESWKRRIQRMWLHLCCDTS